ncbi:MAG: ATPase [Rhodospirillales bacterium]|nr:ATPase [Rhodospirillales bacterium]
MLRAARRFYVKAAVVCGAGGFGVALDGRPVRTPARSPLVVPTAALAAAIANEWLAQGETLRPEMMPLTRLAATTIDRIAVQREAIVAALAEYGSSDLICYRAAEPPDLVSLQTALWQPLIEWAARACGARMTVSVGVLPMLQPQRALDGLHAMVEAASDRQLAALSTLVQASGSLIIGLAVVHGHLDAEGAAEAALLDERWQAARWGIDAEAEARRAEIVDDISAAALFLQLSGDAGGSAAPADAATDVPQVSEPT